MPCSPVYVYVKHYAYGIFSKTAQACGLAGKCACVCAMNLFSGRYGKALWWTSSEVGNEVEYRYVRAIDSALYDATAMKTRGFAVRCIQDAQRVAPNDLME